MINIDLRVIERVFVEADEKYLKIASIGYDDEDITIEGIFNMAVYSSYFEEEEFVKVKGTCTFRIPKLEVLNNPGALAELKIDDIEIYSIYLPDSETLINDEKDFEEFLKVDYDTLISDIFDFSEISFHTKTLAIE